MIPAHRQGDRPRRGQLSLSGRKHPPLSRGPKRSSAMIAEAGFVRAAAEPMLGRAGRDPLGLEDLTSSVTHLWRLLKWGRMLARHGALRGIERDPKTPPPVRRLARIARFGARIPPTPDYAAALRGDRSGRDQARPGARDPAGSGRRARGRKSVAAAGRSAAGALSR